MHFSYLLCKINQNFSGSVSENDFLTYYASLSASIESDDAFVYMVRGCWGLSVEDFNRAPPAPMLKQRHGPPVPPPQAKQTHGNVLTWNQEVSDFEKSTSSPPNCKKVNMISLYDGLLSTVLCSIVNNLDFH